MSSASNRRQFAVQKPKGKAWETLSLVDDLRSGKVEFKLAVQLHGRAPIRLIQIDYTNDEALSDFDWHLIELHDPNKGDRPRPTLIAGKERAAPKSGKEEGARKTRGQRTNPGSSGQEEKLAVPVRTYIVAFLFGAMVILMWALTFKT